MWVPVKEKHKLGSHLQAPFQCEGNYPKSFRNVVIWKNGFQSIWKSIKMVWKPTLNIDHLASLNFDGLKQGSGKVQDKSDKTVFLT